MLNLAFCCHAGGEGAPDLTESLKNLVVNSLAVAVLSGVLAWDFNNSSKEKRSIEREEALGKLQVGSSAMS